MRDYLTRKPARLCFTGWSADRATKIWSSFLSGEAFCLLHIKDFILGKMPGRGEIPRHSFSKWAGKFSVRNIQSACPKLSNKALPHGHVRAATVSGKTRRFQAGTISGHAFCLQGFSSRIFTENIKKRMKTVRSWGRSFKFRQMAKPLLPFKALWQFNLTEENFDTTPCHAMGGRSHPKMAVKFYKECSISQLPAIAFPFKIHSR